MITKEAIHHALTDTYENGVHTFANEVLREFIADVVKIANEMNHFCGDTASDYYQPCGTCVICISREVVNE